MLQNHLSGHHEQCIPEDVLPNRKKLTMAKQGNHPADLKEISVL